MADSDSASGADKKKVIVVIGGGPKALAIASKAKVLNDLKLLNARVIILEKNSIGANWDGRFGFTDGQQVLGTPPEKDVGFPYKSVFGHEVDKAMLCYSWQMFLIGRGLYADWVDRGKNHPRHQLWAEYLRWVHQEVSPEYKRANVTAIRPKDRAIELGLKEVGEKGEKKLYADGVVLTGPGEPVKIQGSSHGWSENILNGRDFWRWLAIFSKMENGKVAVIGGGETAATIVLALLDLAPRMTIDLINRHGTIYTRGESYHENRVYTEPEDWLGMDYIDRDEFIRRTDRGVFSVAAKKIIDQASNIHIRTGNVIDLEDEEFQVTMKVQRQKSIASFTYDKVIVAIGFDPLSPLHLLPDHMRAADKLRELRQHIDYHLRIPAPDAPNLAEAPKLNIHVPMLAGFAQGPGFPNLSCLGTLSERILSTYLPEETLAAYKLKG